MKCFYNNLVLIFYLLSHYLVQRTQFLVNRSSYMFWFNRFSNNYYWNTFIFILFILRILQLILLAHRSTSYKRLWEEICLGVLHSVLQQLLSYLIILILRDIGILSSFKRFFWSLFRKLYS